MASARGTSMLVSRVAVAIDLALIVVCFVGFEIGGLIVVPSAAAFLVGDALRPDGATHSRFG
jgi:hypothetical protein